MENERDRIMVTVTRAVGEMLDVLDVAIDKWPDEIGDEELRTLAFEELEDAKDNAGKVYNACQKLLALDVYEYRGRNISYLWTVASGWTSIYHNEIIWRVKEREKATG